MQNYICINNQKIDLTEDQIKQVAEACGIQSNRLSESAVGEIVKIGSYEMVVLEQFGGQTALILKDLYVEESEFAEKGNRYDGSYVDEKCQEFAQKLADIVGWDNIVLHEVDLTSDDGLKDYGTVERRASLITAEMYRRYVEVLDTVNPEKWWWLATPHSTQRHGNDAWVKCVSPSGFLSLNCDSGFGVRPFCILKSNIFVSK